MQYNTKYGSVLCKKSSMPFVISPTCFIYCIPPAMKSFSRAGLQRSTLDILKWLFLLVYYRKRIVSFPEEASRTCQTEDQKFMKLSNPLKQHSTIVLVPCVLFFTFFFLRVLRPPWCTLKRAYLDSKAKSADTDSIDEYLERMCAFFVFALKVLTKSVLEQLQSSNISRSTSHVTQARHMSNVLPTVSWDLPRQNSSWHHRN